MGASRGNARRTLREAGQADRARSVWGPSLPDGAEIHNVLSTEITMATASFSSLSLSLRNSCIHD